MEEEEEEEGDGERGDGMKLCFLRAHTERGHDVARRQDRARYTTRAKVGIRNKKKGKGERKKKKKKAEEEKQAKGLGFAACFGRS